MQKTGSVLSATPLPQSKELPESVSEADEALASLGINEELRDYNNIFDTSIINNRVVNKTGVLFPRLDTAKEIEYIQSIMKTK